MVSPAQIDELRSLPLFRGVDPGTIQSLGSSALLRKVNADSHLFSEGERPEFLHVLRGGIVELYSQHGGHSFGFSLLRPYSVFILAAVLLDAPYLNSAATLEKSEVFMIPVSAFRRAIATDPMLARTVEAETALAYRRVMKECKNQRFRPAGERLANWLLQNMKPDGLGGVVHLPFNKRKLASHIGATPETLSRLLGELNAYGVHSSSSAEIMIDDPVTLAGYAGPDPFLDE
ncbi:MAG: helix-turn-helix domain-containing protein [Beijerinckiaceae bacterium]